MSAISIGIQVIMPKTGTSPQTPPQPNDDESEFAAVVAQQAPPPPGMGKLVDKTV